MGWEEASAYLESLGVDAMKGLKPSLHRMEAICAALDHPERRVQALHIAGTNGKTSTARIAASLLQATGLSVGTFTSPHLHSVRERIALDGDPVAEGTFGEVFDHLSPYLDLVEHRLREKLSYFEVVTAMFLLWATEAPVDVAVIEVGLGGTWDATNVVPASVSVVTNVALDHTDLLGSDVETIATEKAGVVKPGTVVVTAERAPKTLSVILDRATAVGATVSKIGTDFGVIENRVAYGGRYLSLRTSVRTYEGLFLSLHGAHQGVNAATALEAVSRFLPLVDLGDELVAEGLGRVSPAGRMEQLASPDTKVPIVLDVAHNPDGMSVLVTSLLEEFAFDRALVVAGFMVDKDIAGMLGEIARLPARLFVGRARIQRSAPPESIAELARGTGLDTQTFDTVAAALAAALADAGAGDLLCITGSHYVVGEARAQLGRTTDQGGASDV